LTVGVVTLAAAVAGRRWLPAVPYMLTGIVRRRGGRSGLCAPAVSAHVATIGALPSAIPPLSWPDFSLDAWRELAPSRSRSR
jgi:SulP family sulfate permease